MFDGDKKKNSIFDVRWVFHLINDEMIENINKNVARKEMHLIVK